MPKENNNEEDNSFPGIFEERKIFGRTLIKFIESIKPTDIKDSNNPEDIDDIRVISINADWGFGKTTFMNSLKTELVNNNFTVFTFNAWINDYEQAPFKSFIQDLIPQMMEAVNYDSTSDERKINLINNTKSLINETVYQGTSAISITTPMGFTIKSKGIDPIKAKSKFKKSKEKLKKFYPEDIDITTSKEKSFIKELKEQFELRMELIYKEIQDSKLNEIKHSIVPTPDFKIEEIKKKKIIILIDELDRCRPTFAIELLEVIKHFFDTGKYLFIFTINSKQLISSVKQVYGDGFEDTGYFRRFFDYELSLPQPDRKKFLDTQIQILKNTFKNQEVFLDNINSMLLLTTLSLRDYEKVINYLKLFFIINTERNFTLNEQFYLILGISIKFLSPNLFTDYFINNSFNLSIKKNYKNDSILKNIFCHKKIRSSVATDISPILIGLSIINRTSLPSELIPTILEGKSCQIVLELSFDNLNLTIVSWDSSETFVIKQSKKVNKIYYPDKQLNFKELNKILSFGNKTN